jgi:hypothetical protein
MSEDPRCCGTGTRIINHEGLCWCGQVWDGEKMCMPQHKQDKMLSDEESDSDQQRRNIHQLNIP